MYRTYTYRNKHTRVCVTNFSFPNIHYNSIHTFTCMHIGILDIGPLTYGFNPVHDEIVKQMKLSSRKLSSRVAASSEVRSLPFQ